MYTVSEASEGDHPCPEPTGVRGRSPLYGEILHLVDEEFRRYRRHLGRWGLFNSVTTFRWKDADGEELTYSGLAFGGSVRRMYWERAGTPFMKQIAIRVLKAVASMTDERGLDRRQAVLDAADLLKHRCMATFHKTMAQIDGTLVHGHFGSRDSWRPPPAEQLTAGMDSFIDGIALGWLEARFSMPVPVTSTATPAISSEPAIVVPAAPVPAPVGDPVVDHVDVVVVPVGGGHRVEIVRRVGGHVADQAVISTPKLVRLFLLVHEAKGRVMSWKEVERAWMASDWSGPTIELETLREYGRRVGRALKDKGLGKYWKYSPETIWWDSDSGC